MSLKRILPAVIEMPLVSDLEWQLANVEAIGYERGLADQHFEDRTFGSGAEYVVWLRGWRQGQIDRNDRVAQELAQVLAFDRRMRRLM